MFLKWGLTCALLLAWTSAYAATAAEKEQARATAEQAELHFNLRLPFFSILGSATGSLATTKMRSIRIAPTFAQCPIRRTAPWWKRA